MIVIKNIDLFEIARERVEISINQKICACDPGAKPTFNTIENEIINGERFYLPDGRKIIIGWSQQVRDAIGIPLTIFGNMRNEIDGIEKEKFNLSVSLRKSKAELTTFKTMNFWNRLKFLIGIKGDK